MFSLILAFVSMLCAIDCRKITLSASVAISSDTEVPGSYLQTSRYFTDTNRTDVQHQLYGSTPLEEPVQAVCHQLEVRQPETI